MSKTYYKYAIAVTILSENPLPCDISLEEIARNITEGSDSGEWEITEVEQLDEKQAAAALIAQGSDPEFFGLNDDGTEAES